MTRTTNWLRNRVAVGAATLLTGAVLASGGLMAAPAGAVADEASGAPSSIPAQTGTVGVVVNGTYGTNAAHALLDRANAVRAEAGLDPLAWSTGLEAAAQNDASLHAFDADLVSAGSGKLLARAGGTAPADLFETLLGQQASRDALLSPEATALGIGCFTAGDGTVALVAYVGTATADASVAGDGSAQVTLPVSTADLTIDISVPGSFEVGGQGSATYTIGHNGSTAHLAAAPQWSSSDPGVATVDAATGAVTAVAPGTATLTLSVDGVALGGGTVTVHAPTAQNALPDGPASLECAFGEDPTPQLPTTAIVTWSNGSTTSEPVSWDAIDPASVAIGGNVFTVSGTAAGLPVSTSVTVGMPAISSVAQPQGIATERGVQVDLPASATATYQDGSTADLPVVWDSIPDDAWNGQGGFDVAGWVDGWDEPVMLHITLNEPAPTPEPGPDPDSGDGATGDGTEGGGEPGTGEGAAPDEGGNNGEPGIGEGAEPDAPDSGDDDPDAGDGGADAPGIGGGASPDEEDPSTDTDDPAGPDNPDAGDGGADAPGIGGGASPDEEGPSTDTDDPAGPDTPDTDDTEGGSGENEGTGGSPDAEDPDTGGDNGGGEGDAEGDEPGAADLADVASFTNPPTIYVRADAAWEPAQTIDVVLPDGTASTVDAAWQYPEGGTPDAAGMLKLTHDFRVDGAVQQAVQQVQFIDEGVNSIDIPCEVGNAVELPKSLTMYYDGTAVDVPVSWDAIPEGATEAAGSFTVEGAIPGNMGPVVAYVTVEKGAPIINGITDPDPVSTVAGTVPVLPETVAVTYKDGSTGTAMVTWEPIDPERYAQPGSFTVAGTVEGTDLRASVTVKVEAAPAAAQSVQKIDVETFVGTAPELPKTVQVTYADGSVKDIAVTWDAIDENLYAKPGTFTVSGSLEGIEDLKASASVTVKKLTVKSIKGAEASTVAGTAPKLPETVEVTWADGTITSEKVEWDTVAAESYAKAGTFTVSGSIAGDEAAKAVCTVTVKAAQAAPASVTAPANVNTDAGTAPTLPATVDVTYSDGTVKQHKVVWDAVNPASYHNGGTFTVNGKVEGTDLTVRATVVVANAKVTGVQNNLTVQTTPNVAPKLPATASIRWSNGDVTDEKVTWSAVDPQLYAKNGTFTVKGTVAGYSVSCTVTVVDQVAKTGDAVTPAVAVALIGGAVGVGVIAAAAALLLRHRKQRG